MSGKVLIGNIKGPDYGVMSAYIAPKVVILADAATVEVDASLGNEFDLTLGGDRLMDTPVNLANGEHIIFRIRQPASGGPWSVGWSTGYSFGDDSAPDLSTAANALDFVAFDYDAVKGKCCYLGIKTGF